MLKILFVDDDAIARKNMFQRIDWKAYGWELIYTARDAVEALDYIKRDEPNIIISDIKMPIMDGIEMARIAKEYYPDIFFIFLSGYKEFEYAKQALELQAIDYLNKPINNEELIKVIQKAEEQYFRIQETKKIVSERYPLIKRHYISKLMYNSFQEADDDVFKAFDININAGYGIAMFMDIKGIAEDVEIPKLFLMEYCTQLTKQYKGSLFFAIDESQIFVIYTKANCTSKDKFKESVLELESEISQYIKFNFHVTPVFYRGTIMSDINGLYDSYQRALQEKNGEINQLLSSVKRFIETNFSNPDLSLTQIAENFNINHCYLTRLYKEQFGINLYDYVIQVRMEKAAEYLKTTDLKSYEIAEATGYRNSQYFSMSFKKYYGCTIRDYKKDK